MPSTVIRRFDYNAGALTLDVEFVSGRRYRYVEVPETVASAFAGAFAKGRFFNARIRDKFVCHELTEEAAGDLWSL
jgi:lysyl-tRNA synthetase class 2